MTKGSNFVMPPIYPTMYSHDTNHVNTEEKKTENKLSPEKIMAELEKRGISVPNKTSFKNKLEENFAYNDGTTSLAVSSYLKYRRKGINKTVLEACIDAAECWRRFLINEEDISKVILHMILGYAKLRCSVLHNRPTQKAYIGKYFSVKTDELPDFYYATIVTESGNKYRITEGRKEEILSKKSK